MKARRNQQQGMGLQLIVTGEEWMGVNEEGQMDWSVNKWSRKGSRLVRSEARRHSFERSAVGKGIDSP